MPVTQGNKCATFVQQGRTPEGSSLCLLTFYIFINDIPSICSECCVRYADDTVLCTSKTNLLQIESALQADLNTLQHYNTANKLLLK